ncbi:MAG: FAD-binding domain-containing protein [Pseudomonadota bacterium]
MTKHLNIVWFKRDLRIYDHRPLISAAQNGAVLPLFVIEPVLWQQPDMSARHWSFVSECLLELREELAKLGQPLIVRVGSVIDILSQFHKTHRIAHLWSHEETGNAWTYKRDLKVKKWCQAHSIFWQESQNNGVIRKLRSRNGWAAQWDAFMAEPITLPPKSLNQISSIEPGIIPTAPDLRLKQDPCPGRQKGGRDIGLQYLESFLNKRGTYYRKDMSSPVTAFTGCSRISPYLAWGVFSMREVAQTTWQRQRNLKIEPQPPSVKFWRSSMVSFTGRLHWHCHFIQKLEDEPRLEFENLHRAYDGLRSTRTNCKKLAAWSNGEIGLPFFDACMRALKATGWMNFRMRAMLMAVASYHLWLDWRKPGEHLARLFTDYEPGIHWPQVQMQSGTTGINSIRIYNPVKQGYDQDAKGVFIRKWLPELRGIPDQFLHEPWKWDQCGSILDKHYPFPIIDYLQAAKHARQKIWAVRKSGNFYEKATQIQDKHGSRKSGIPTRRQKKTEAQQNLPLEG